MSQSPEKNYDAFNEQKARNVALIRQRRPNFDMVRGMLIDELLHIDSLLDLCVDKLDEYVEAMKSFSPQANTDILIRIIYTIRRDPEYLKRTHFPGPAEAIYALQLKSLEALSENIDYLNGFENKLKTLKSSAAARQFPEVFDLLRKTILPGDKIDKHVLDFLIDDVAEIRDIYFQIYQELKLFKALCALIESFPRETVVQMLDEAEEEPTPIQ